MEKLLEVFKWFSNLDTKGILKVALAVIFFGSGYYIYELKKENEKLSDRITSADNRYRDNLNLLQKAIDDCNKSRFEDLEEANKYWRDRVEEIERRSSVNYKNIREIKNYE